MDAKVENDVPVVVTPSVVVCRFCVGMAPTGGAISEVDSVVPPTEAVATGLVALPLLLAVESGESKELKNECPAPRRELRSCLRANIWLG